MCEICEKLNFDDYERALAHHHQEQNMLIQALILDIVRAAHHEGGQYGANILDVDKVVRRAMNQEGLDDNPRLYDDDSLVNLYNAVDRLMKEF